MLKNQLSFNSGYCSIYKIENTAEYGENTNEELVIRRTCRFLDKVVGSSRFFLAKQANENIERVIVIPLFSEITTFDEIVINDERYKIIQIQHFNDTKPCSTQLSLSRVGVM